MLDEPPLMVTIRPPGGPADERGLDGFWSAMTTGRPAFARELLRKNLQVHARPRAARKSSGELQLLSADGAIEVERGADQRQMGERLGEVAQSFAVAAGFLAE